MERLTVGEAAERLEISQQAVRKRVQRGTLPNSKQDGRVYVYLDSETGPVGHVSTVEVDNPVSPLSSMQRDEDEAVTTVAQSENTKIKEWWQTRLGKLVVACYVAVLVLVLAAFIFRSVWAVIAALVLGGGIPLGLAVWAMALGVYDIATGRDDEVATSEAETSSEQATEISKLCFEYFKHFTTITTAAALVELALYQQLGLSKASAVLGVGWLGFTLWLCIRGLVRLSVGAATSGNFLPIEQSVRRRMKSTAWFFLSGVVLFALAAVNAPYANTASHLMYETAKSMAQNIR